MAWKNDDRQAGRFLRIIVLALAALALGTVGAEENDAEVLLAKIDRNQSYRTIYYEGRMEIISGKKTKVKTMKAWASGKDKAFIEYNNPEDRGVRFLKLGKNLWMYFPKERDTVKIAGALLRQGMMGSDFSYEEAMESDNLITGYSASMAGKEVIDDRPCVVLELKAKSKDSSYARRRLWVDEERNIILKAELYAKSSLLLKTSRTLKVVKLGTRYFPSVVELADAIKKDSRTVLTMDELSLDESIDDSRFSLQTLTK
ncbi:MAG: outer membrane lipoprotein-sorting protein [Spirochaetes bacterium]|nr:outer membrane lipoprotein-sorting protein [Spirochaetota bacterium]